MGKNGKVTEHPKKIDTLKKRGHYITRADRRLHLHYTVRQLLNPHTRPTWVPEFGQSNSRAAIIAPRSMPWEAFSEDSLQPPGTSCPELGNFWQLRARH